MAQIGMPMNNSLVSGIQNTQQNKFQKVIEDGWSKVHTGAIVKVQQFLITGDSSVVFTKKEYIQYYSIVYNLCTIKYDQAQKILYSKYTDSIKQYLEVNVKNDLETQSGQELLRRLDKRWADHQIMVKWMRFFFQYLDRYYVEMESITQLKDQGFKIFKEVVFKPSCDATTQAIIKEIHKQRVGEMSIYSEQLKSTLQIYLDLSEDKLAHDGWLPRVNLEKAILDQTEQFYSAKSKEIMDSTNLIDYLKSTDKFYEEELQRKEQIFKWSIGDEVIKTFRREMLIKPQQQLLNKGEGLSEFLKESRYDDLKLLYKLYKEEQESLWPIGLRFKEFIANKGTDLLKSVELYHESKLLGPKEILSTSQVIDNLLQMQDDFNHILEFCFEGNQSFAIQKASGFEAFINFEIGPYTVAELLSTHSDNILRKNGFKAPSDQFEAHLEKIVLLFSHLADKDIFISSFKNFLARRLLSEKSESIDYERGIVSRLKVNCGRAVTDSIEGMMNDLELGKEQAKKYQDQRKSKVADVPVDFDVKILTKTHWPAYKFFNLSVPLEINTCMEDFANFYKNQPANHHRELNWNFAMGTAMVNAKLPNGGKTYDLQVSTYQMCILYLFNHYVELTLEEIAEHMGFDTETCKKNVQSLTTPRAKLLSITDGKFKVNAKFTSQVKRVQFPVPILEASVKKEKVTQDRSHAVDAALVRVMKARKKMQYKDLVLEIVSLMRTFKPDDALCKKRVASLIERDYLETDKNDENLIIYKA